jgi:hygromycin-B 7''-O-kinase
MGEVKVYSERLGAISDAQFQVVAERLNLGRFLKAEPTAGGLFGQNVFVTTTEGEFVLRGAPHWVKTSGDADWRREDRWQFTKERFFARLLHERTRAPVPWPMLHDETCDIFGWPYLVMPRMPGRCFDDRSIVNALDAGERNGAAIALGEMLAEMQSLTWPFAGDFDRTAISLEPFAGGAIGHAIAETNAMAATARANNALTDDDLAWIGALSARARDTAGGGANAYVHCDYKLNNLTLAKLDGVWQVTGLFDLHEARFADGALDIVRQACAYLDHDPRLAQVFADAYFGSTARDPRLSETMPFHVVNDRMKFWEFFTRPGVDAPWLRGKTFRGWVQPYVDAISRLS